MVTTPSPALHREIRAYLEFVDLARDGQTPELPPDRPARGRNYVVIENTPGYLPEDDDPPTFDSYDEAWNYAIDEAHAYVDHLYDIGETKPTVRGDKGFGWVHVDTVRHSRHWSVNSLLPCDVPLIDDEGF